MFDGGPWDNKAVEGAHVFSKERKLLYGNQHDSAEHLAVGQDASSYGVKEKHKLHTFWMKNSLKMLADLSRRAKQKGEEASLRKVAARSGPQREVWPGFQHRQLA